MSFRRKTGPERSVDTIRKGSLPKLREKLLEALQAVLPIVAIVLVLCFSIAPVSPSILLCFLLGAAMIIVGIMFFTLGAEMSMSPMGERVGAVLTRSRSAVSYTHLRAHETDSYLVCRLLLEKKKEKEHKKKKKGRKIDKR